MESRELTSRPSTWSQYLRAAVARKTGKGAAAEGAPLAEITLRGVTPDPDKLAAYRKVCEFRSGTDLPLTFPFVLALPLHLELLLSDAFPYSPVGLVHVHNRITRHRAIAADETVDIHCTLSGPQPAGKGEEFSILTRVTVRQELVWSCDSTMLKRSGTGEGRHPSGTKPQAESEAFTPDATLHWTLPGNLGRRYGRASSDVNPIHLHGLTARLFGFPKAIAHGMWTKARCLAELEPLIPAGPCSVDVAFKLPVFLPGEVQFQYHRTPSGAFEFRVMDGKGEKPHLTGRLALGLPEAG